MSKVLDPVLDFFIQIPLSAGNILRFLSHHGFQVSTVQSSTGETKNILFYHTLFPKKTVQFDESHKGVENFLYSYQKTFFLILDKYEITFLLRTPTEEHGVAIGIQNNNELYPVRKVNYSGESKNEEFSGDIHTDITLKGLEDAMIGQQELQKFFMSFVTNKTVLNITDLNNERLHRQMNNKTADEKLEWL